MNQTKPITDPIRRNNLPLFSRSPVREKSTTQFHLSSLKNDCSLFSRLFVASQMCDGDLDDFFAYENQACPPVLSQMGKIRLDKKSDLVGYLEGTIPPQDNVASHHVEVIILDGASITNMLAPGGAKTFSDYATQVFLSYITSQLPHSFRVDVVWDEYLPDREVEASGDESCHLVPYQELAGLPTDRREQGRTVLLPSDETSCSRVRETSHQHPPQICGLYACQIYGWNCSMSQCTPGETDTRMLLHVEDAVK